MKFSDLGLGEGVLRAVSDAGYETPTPIQEAAIPQVLMGRDVLGTAQTGTGKTAGFTLPMIDILASGRARARMPRSLILEPTRELAAQVAENFETYGKYHKMSMALLIGGVSFDEQFKKLDRGVDVLIATPGRLLDHFERGRILLSDLKILVIDEADRMLDMGFIPDIERIVGLLPPLRQTLFFSATMAPEIRRLADRFLMNPKEISVSPPASPAKTVTQALTVMGEMDKRDALRQLLRSEDDLSNALVFCNRKKDVDILFRSLQKHGFSVGALHGDMAQSTRMETLQKFKSGEFSLMIASDVAARGLDIASVSHVFNFDVPIHAEDYIHRIGRTGRAGRSGKAFMFATPSEGIYVEAIEKLIGRPIERFDLEGIRQASLDDAERPSRGKGRQRRPGGSSGSKSGGSRSDGRKPAAEKSTKEKSANAPKKDRPPREQRPEKPESQQRTPAKKPSQPGPAQKQGEPVKGMGDHMPDFLTRPARAKKSEAPDS